MSGPKYIIGIDLGTTNSVVAYAKTDVSEDQKPAIRIFETPQLVDPGSVGKREILPSSVLLPGPHDVPEGGLAVPWADDQSRAVGVFARDRGAEIPHRLISSSKSWLCHAAVDRNEPILPWESGDDQRKLSPVEASAAILQHIKDAWNHTMAGDTQALRLEEQDIVLTVPASFDVVARNLTVKAAEMAGIDHVILLEEPQAAFYAWIDEAKDTWRDKVTVGDVILVVDVGGGTTDFSLIKVAEDRGELILERIAVGEHVLVGGDNMDLTLAYAVAHRMASQGHKLDPHQMKFLCHGCRAAKEHLFEDTGMDVYPIAILGRGSRLIGGTLKTELKRREVDEVLTNGFFPECEKDVQLQKQPRTGMREMGLEYSADPAVTRHLARFLNSQEGPIIPSAVIFNGGVMKAGGLRRQILRVLTSWLHAEDQSQVREIEGGNLDLAVAKGAAYYGLARQGRGIRIRGGLAQAYYIGIEAALPAVPGIPIPIKALCLAPFGMEEGTEAALPEKEFGLVTGEPVKFDFLGSHVRRHDTIGTVIEDWAGEIETITTLETRLEGDAGTVLPVTLHVKATEVGTLEIWCVSCQDDRKFKLEFNVRGKD
jgi:hypothetical protein